MSLKSILSKTIRVGLGTTAVVGSIQLTSELCVWGRDPNLALARIQAFTQYPTKQ